MSATRPQFILAKPPSDRVSSHDSRVERHADSTSSKSLDKAPVIVLKTRGGGEDGATGGLSLPFSSPNIQSLLASDSLPRQAYPGSSQRHIALRIEGSVPTRITHDAKQSVKMVDESFNWNESGMEMVMDQSDFFTIGVIGPQGSGKSTVASLLAGNSISPTSRYAFRSQTQEAELVSSHETVGVDMFVTGERIIILDTQPLLSASLLDGLMEHDKKYGNEYSTTEYSVEMQSLQITAFMMTVCHVLIVVVDWFIDINLLRFLQAAEMLKPVTPSASHDGSSTEANSEFYPQIVFVLNQAERESFSIHSQNAMHATIAAALKGSKLKYRGGITMANAGLIAGINRKQVPDNVNLFVLPSFHAPQHNRTHGVGSPLPQFSGHPPFKAVFASFRSLLFGTPRSLLTHTVLSERNWFHYAARTWEGIKKSPLFAEYNRLYSQATQLPVQKSTFTD